MKKEVVNIDFKKMATALKNYVREAALLSGNTIVYIEDGEVVEENPRTSKTRILKRAYVA